MEKTNHLRRNMVEIIMFLSYALFAVLWVAGSSFTPQIMDYFGIKTFSSATFISNAITLAKIIGNLCAASILTKLMPKKAIGLASFLIFFGSILAVFAPSFIIFTVCRFIMGFGGALLVVYFGTVVVHYFEPKERIVINGINGSSYNVGSIFAMFMITPIFTAISNMNFSLLPWQSTMLLFSLVSLVLLVLWFMFSEDYAIQATKPSEAKGAAQQPAQAQEAYTFAHALKDKFNYLYPFCYSGLLSLYIVILTMYPNSKGASINPKLLSATIALSGVIGAVAGIVLAKKLTKRLPIMRISGVCMTLFAFVLFNTQNQALAIVSAVMLGFFMFLPNTSLIMLPQELPNITPAKITMIMGMFYSISYIIQSLQYYICGILIDKTGDFMTSLIFTAVFSLTFVLGSFLLPETGKAKA